MFNFAKNNILKAAILGALAVALPAPALAQPGVGGTYAVSQRNSNGAQYFGTLYLNGGRGQMVWNNHQQCAPFQTYWNGSTMNFTLQYPNGLQGAYSVCVSGDGSQLYNGGTRSSYGDTGSWSAQRR